MTAPRDPDRLIASYLDDGPTELAGDSYVAVDEAVHRTRQRTVIGPWRTRPVTFVPRLIVAAAVIVVATVIGVTLFPRASAPGPASTSTATPSVSNPPSSASGSSEPSSGPPVYRWPAALAPGTYTTSFAWDDSLQFTFTVPAGWQSLDINVAKNDRIALVFYPIVGVAAPTCASPEPSSPAVWTPDTVLTALDRLVDFDAPPVDASVGDRTARYVTFSAQTPMGCAGADDVVFRTPTPICRPDVCGNVGPPTFGLEFGPTKTHHERLWLMAVGRSVVAMNAVWTDEATAAEIAELQSIIDSARLDTPLATPAPQVQPTGSGATPSG